MSVFGELRTRWMAITTDSRPCPECGEPLEDGYARDHRTQEHWRGVEAFVCSSEEGCGYAERR